MSFGEESTSISQFLHTLNLSSVSERVLKKLCFITLVEVFEVKLKLIPALLTLGLATFLGACETVSENAPTQPGSEAEVPQGGAELDDTETPKYPPAPDAVPDDSPDEASGIPAVPDAEAPAIPDAPDATDSTEPQAP
ncbi:hypothetical protein ON05_003630 [Acaryochloris sp. CCMEE 5410]|nr:hypothetical protein ON05_003630 [Acaryochloris sp. CCMEE 5410]